MLKRPSATIRKTASAEQNDSFVSDDGPWRKKGGGVRSRVPSAMWGSLAANDYGRAPRRPKPGRAPAGGKERSDCGGVIYSEVKIDPRRSIRSSAMPQPRTTHVSGS